MTYIVDKGRELIAMLCVLSVSILSSLSTALLCLFAFSIVDVFAGWAANSRTNEEEFKFRKAFNSIYKLGFFFLLAILVHIATFFFGEIELSRVLVKYLTWIISYWYMVNITNNARKIFPSSEALKFLHQLLTVQILEVLVSRLGMNLSRIKIKEEKTEENKDEQ